MFKYKVHSYIITVGVALLTACTTLKTVDTTLPDEIPGSYYGSTDTTTIATLPVSSFFTDTYLLQLIDTAFGANPDILAALQRVEAANANLKYNGLLWAPAINLNARAGVERYGDYTLNGVGNYDTNLSPNINGNQRIPNPTPEYFLGFQSSWELDLWGKLRSRKKAAFNRFLASRSGYKMVTTSLTSQIATAYYQLLALDNELRVIRKNIELQNNALEIIKVQKLGGRATELAVQQFLAQLKRTQGLEAMTKQQITETENQLNFLTGNFSKSIPRDTSINTLKVPSVLKAGIPSQLLLNRPDIQQADFELRAMNADIKAVHAAFFPTLTLSPYVGFNAFRSAVLFNSGSLAYGILGGVTAPIFNRKQIKADYERTIAEGKQALYSYQKTVLNSYQEVLNSMKSIENYTTAYRNKQQEVQALNNAVSVANDLYLVGRANYLEVITAQRNVLDAELELAHTKKNIFFGAINLYRSVGGGWKR
ncbi:TolC family protein [Mucilaginibacter aquatilis]|uniref:Efflux transporter outer membrane subunit n=1 Tax=Mucilaginibacter aquatilis TaxID=1517760 RepID=A0A6I4I9X7_9SPHI|nr:TolC family protein [Mucilaginibacter aquatilis]MVN90798.1 efflux transporter outer membrane subunit [Mucilaginibacter aquatilis]